jgi:hypothetical protein
VCVCVCVCVCVNREESTGQHQDDTVQLINAVQLIQPSTVLVLRSHSNTI